MKTLVPVGALAALSFAAFGEIAGSLPDATHAWSVHDRHRPMPPTVKFDARGIPSDAVVLFDGTEETYRRNWRNGDKPADWTFENGTIHCGKSFGWIRTAEKFGDCQLHVEWATPTVDGPQHGNSGIYLMGFYEIQIIDSRELAPGKYHDVLRSPDEFAAAVYGQKPPLVNPCKAPGEWQTYDIVFHQPVRGADGKLLHPGTLTIFHNGVLVQDDREIEGPTLYMKRTADRVHPDRASLCLQGHGGDCRYRRVWLRELTSPWKEDLVSGTSRCDPADVAKQRVANAERVFASLDGKPVTYAAVRDALEMLSYSSEPKFAAKADSLAVAYAAALDAGKTTIHSNAVKRLAADFDAMRSAGCMPRGWRLEQIVRERMKQ